jgi:hypothetical protein
MDREPAIDRRPGGGRDVRHLVVVASGIAVLGIGTTIITPLFPIYQSDLALGHGWLAAVAAVYGVSIIPAMLVAGRLSDRWGRAALLGPGLACFALGDLVLASAGGLGGLLAGRLLQGLAMGASFGPAAALMADVADARRPDLPALATAVASLAGFGLGPLLTVAVIEAGWVATRAPFLLHALLLAAAAAGLATVVRARGRAASPAAPGAGPVDQPGARRLAVLAGVGAWAVYGVLFVMLAVLVRPLVEPGWRAAGGLAMAVLSLAGALALLATRRWGPARLLGAGALAQALGVGLLVLALAKGTLPVTLLAVTLIGLGLAAVHRGGIGLSIGATPAARRGRAISGFLAAAYFAAYFPVLAFGVAADAWGLLAALAGYAAVFGVVLAGAGACALIQQPVVGGVTGAIPSPAPLTGASPAIVVERPARPAPGLPVAARTAVPGPRDRR